MTKQEFLEELRKALSSRVSSATVNENVSYYEEYIATQTRMGRTEEEVLDELGDPRLLARSIAEAEERAGQAEERKEAVRETGSGMLRNLSVQPVWVLLLIALLVVIALIAVAFSLFRVFWPLILAAVVLSLVLRLFKK